MIARSFLLALGATCVLSASAVSQDPTAKKAPAPEILAKIKTLDAAVKDRKFKRDSEAVGIIDELLQEYADMHPKSQAAFVKSLDKVFKAKQRKKDNTSLYIATIACLGEIGGAEASKPLVKAFSNKKFSKREDWAPVQDAMLEAIGKCKDPKQVKMLIDEAADSPHDGIKSSAGKALRHYGEHSFKVRKSIVKELVKAFSRVHNGANQSTNQDPVQQTFRATLRKISDPWNDTLNILTGETFRDAPEWNRWWNKNKNSPKKWKNQADGK